MYKERGTNACTRCRLLMLQVRGRKRMLLYTPDELQSLYPYPDDSLLRRRARVDPANPDLTRFPRFSEASAFEAVLEPGMSSGSLVFRGALRIGLPAASVFHQEMSCGSRVFGRITPSHRPCPRRLPAASASHKEMPAFSNQEMTALTRAEDWGDHAHRAKYGVFSPTICPGVIVWYSTRTKQWIQRLNLRILPQPTDALVTWRPCTWRRNTASAPHIFYLFVSRLCVFLVSASVAEPRTRFHFLGSSNWLLQIIIL